MTAAMTLRTKIRKARIELARSCSCDAIEGRNCEKHQTIEALYHIEVSVVQALMALETRIRGCERKRVIVRWLTRKAPPTPKARKIYPRKMFFKSGDIWMCPKCQYWSMNKTTGICMRTRCRYRRND